MKAIDDAIRDSYVEFSQVKSAPLTADDILCDPGVEDSFWSFVNGRFPSTCSMRRPELNRRLLALRKKGADKGGLPKSVGN